MAVNSSYQNSYPGHEVKLSQRPKREVGAKIGAMEVVTSYNNQFDNKDLPTFAPSPRVLAKAIAASTRGAEVNPQKPQMSKKSKY